MALVHFNLTSQGQERVVSDGLHDTHYRIERLDVHTGRWIESNETFRTEGPGSYSCDLLQHNKYRVDFDVPGFLAYRADNIQPTEGATIEVALPSRVVLLPDFDSLDDFQERLLGSMADRAARSVWADLSDNQCASFYQITYALRRYGNGVLAPYIVVLLRVGGSEMKCPSGSNEEDMRTVKGWRIHVRFNMNRERIEKLLRENGFGAPRDAVNVHSDCGYARSFRSGRIENEDLKLQICLEESGTGADIDLDTGALHRSAPWHIYKPLCNAYGDVSQHYRVLSG